jgi:hypothetical protein
MCKSRVGTNPGSDERGGSRSGAASRATSGAFAGASAGSPRTSTFRTRGSDHSDPGARHQPARKNSDQKPNVDRYAKEEAVASDDRVPPCQLFASPRYPLMPPANSLLAGPDPAPLLPGTTRARAASPRSQPQGLRPRPGPRAAGSAGHEVRRKAGGRRVRTEPRAVRNGTAEHADRTRSSARTGESGESATHVPMRLCTPAVTVVSRVSLRSLSFRIPSMVGEFPDAP